MKFDANGQLRAINPEAGFFGVAPALHALNPNAMRTLHANTIFTNCALTPDRDVWWEEMTDTLPPQLTSWKGEAWTPSSGAKAANPNARYTTPARQCPVMDPAWEDPAGVPISAILFGGRRPTTVPLCLEAPTWQYGTFLGSIQASETTAAQAGSVGILRYDPMAMLPFCGYNMGDYFAHWLSMPTRVPNAQMPRIFYVNWFRKSADNRWLWPGFGENSRVLKWIFERIEGAAPAVESPIGLLPTPEALDTTGLNVDPEDIEELLHVNPKEWLQDLPAIRAHYAKYGDAIPAASNTNSPNSKPASAAAPPNNPWPRRKSPSATSPSSAPAAAPKPKPTKPPPTPPASYSKKSKPAKPSPSPPTSSAPSSTTNLPTGKPPSTTATKSPSSPPSPAADPTRP